MTRGLTRAVRWSLMADSQRRSEEAATEIGACLEPAMGGADPRETYAILKHWYRHASAQAPNLSWKDMEKVRGEVTDPL